MVCIGPYFNALSWDAVYNLIVARILWPVMVTITAITKDKLRENRRSFGWLQSFIYGFGLE